MVLTSYHIRYGLFIYEVHYDLLLYLQINLSFSVKISPTAWPSTFSCEIPCSWLNISFWFKTWFFNPSFLIFWFSNTRSYYICGFSFSTFWFVIPRFYCTCSPSFSTFWFSIPRLYLSQPSDSATQDSAIDVVHCCSIPDSHSVGNPMQFILILVFIRIKKIVVLYHLYRI